MSPPQPSDISSGGSPPPALNQQGLAGSQAAMGLDDDVIPTAIVIKNIPFNVPRETLLDIIVSSVFSASLHQNKSSNAQKLHLLLICHFALLYLGLVIVTDLSFPRFRHRSPSPPHMRSITTSILPASSVVLPLPTSALHQMQTLSWLP